MGRGGIWGTAGRGQGVGIAGGIPFIEPPIPGTPRCYGHGSACGASPLMPDYGNIGGGDGHGVGKASGNSSIWVGCGCG